MCTTELVQWVKYRENISTTYFYSVKVLVPFIDFPPNSTTFHKKTWPWLQKVLIGKPWQKAMPSALMSNHLEHVCLLVLLSKTLAASLLSDCQTYVPLFRRLNKLDLLVNTWELCPLNFQPGEHTSTTFMTYARSFLSLAVTAVSFHFPFAKLSSTALIFNAEYPIFSFTVLHYFTCLFRFLCIWTTCLHIVANYSALGTFQIQQKLRLIIAAHFVVLNRSI